MDAQPRRAEGGAVGRSYGNAAAPPEARTLTPFVGLQRRVLPPYHCADEYEKWTWFVAS